ncbi:hypothetical protein RF11_09351 [Thelohanellus kitauei]|uniref:Uncharacterized protein n=1 Tax=Thelohanellus kitauei TaxID=669202 RepID=A0A0C2I902_THEKT|nr:hypothetical protein RF11_09351 [Thelohanellus kitauei]
MVPDTREHTNHIEGMRRDVIEKLNQLCIVNLLLLDLLESTVRSVVKSFESRGTIETKRPHASYCLEALVNDNHHYTLDDLVANLGIDFYPATAWKWLKAMNFSWKITRPIPERRNCEDGDTRTLNIPKSTVNSIIKKFEETEQVSASTRDGSRNTIITQQIKDRIIELMNDDLTTNLREIQQQRMEGTEDLASRMESACTQVSPEELPNYILRSESLFHGCIEKRDIMRE